MIRAGFVTIARLTSNQRMNNLMCSTSKRCCTWTIKTAVCVSLMRESSNTPLGRIRSCEKNKSIKFLSTITVNSGGEAGEN